MLPGLFWSRVGIIGQITDVQKQATVVILFISKEVLSEGANKSGKVPEEIQTAKKTSPEKNSIGMGRENKVNIGVACDNGL